MDRCPPRAACAALLVLALLPASRAAADVTVYRCTDAAGVVTLQDAPCAADSRQEVRTMQRPQDPPPGSRTPPVTVTPAPPPEPAQVVVATGRAPQPMYECVTPDGDTYTSDNGDGNPRFVPLWTLGVYGHGHGHVGSPQRPPAPVPRDQAPTRPPRSGLSTAPVNNISIPSPRNLPQPPPPPSPRPGRPHHGHGYAPAGGGTWIRDSCTLLPAAEVCARLRDRRETIRRRSFNAQQSERRTLRTEERTLGARLAEDCGIR